MTDVADYTERVRAALADLPAATRDELLDDLREHLAEVAAEADGSLADRLGPPETYAAELRAAVGAAPARRNLDDRIRSSTVRVRARLRSLDVAVGPVIGYPAASDFLRLLRPAWWVLRGYLFAMALAYLDGGPSIGLLPRLADSTLVSLLLLPLFVIGSIWFGRRGVRLGRWPGRAVHAATGLAVLIALVGLTDIDGFSRPSEYTPAYYDNGYSSVEDVYVYDQHGNLLDGVRLFDQNGDPIQLGYERCAGTGRYDAATYPLCPELAPFQVPAMPSTTPTPTPTG
ncbi:hypothetical protein WEI85_01580 [Actinomycetes bacterium KLBMP 9797]